MNYLQTDDRDDYFESLKRQLNPPPTFYNLHTITDTSGNVIIDKVRSGECVRFTMKKLKQSRKIVSHNWKRLLKSNGLIVTTKQIPW